MTARGLLGDLADTLLSIGAASAALSARKALDARSRAEDEVELLEARLRATGAIRDSRPSAPTPVRAAAGG